MVWGPTYVFSIASLPTLVTASLVIAFGLRVVTRRRSTTALHLLPVTGAVFVWMLSSAMMASCSSAAAALLWARVGFAGICALPAAVVDFTAVLFEKRERHRRFVWMCWAVALAFALSAVFTNTLIAGVERFPWGYYPRAARGAIAFLIFFFSLIAAGSYKAARTARMAATADDGKRLTLIVAAFGVGYLACIDFLPFFGLNVYPVGYVAVLGWIIAMSHTVSQYDLEITLSVIAKRLLTTMQGIVLVTDAAGIIRVISDSASQVLGYSRDELQNLDISAVARAPAGDATEAFNDREVVWHAKNGQTIDVRASAAVVADSLGQTVAVVYTAEDIRDQKKDEALRASDTRYRLIAENVTDMISRLTPEGTFLYVSPASRALLGFEPGDLLGSDSADLLHPEDLPVSREYRRALLKGNAPSAVSYRLRRRDGRYVWFETTFRAIPLPGSSRIGELIAVSRDVTQRKLVEEEIEYHAYHDALTRLPCRRLFEDRLQIAIANARRRAAREQPAAIAVLFLDIYHFKLINDTFGHSTGDRLLTELGERLREPLRAEDTVARFGGDEFVILLPNVQEPEDAAVVARRVLESVSRVAVVDGQMLFVTASIGISVFPADGDTPELLLSNADAAMYRAKEESRNSYEFCTPSLNLKARQRLEIEGSLRRAMEQDTLDMFFQPIADCGSGSLVGLEGLLRSSHEEHGNLTTEHLIAAAEQSGFIVSLGEWVFEAVLKKMNSWRDAGVSLVRVAVNVSAVQLAQRDLVERIVRLLQRYEIPPEFLELEMTETAVLHNPARALAALRALKAAGVSICIDDFGTGYSSLTYLRSFPIDRIKIDRLFIRNIAEEPSDATIVGALITMAHALGITVVAEGVETEEQAAILRTLGCDFVQGYFYGPAVAGAEIQERLRSRVAITDDGSRSTVAR